MKKIIDFIAKNPVLLTGTLCFLFYFLPFKPKPFGDGQFHTGTLQIIEYILNRFYGEIAIDKGFLTLFCYLIPYSLVYTFHSDNLFFASGVLFNCLFVCMAIHFLFKAFTILMFSNRTKCIVLISISLFPIHIYYAMGIIGEAFAFFTSAVFTYYLVKINKDIPRKKDFLFLSLSLVLLYGIKPNMLPFVLMFAVYLWIIKVTLINKFIFSLGILIIPVLILVEKSLDKSDFEFKNAIFRNQILWSRFELRNQPFNWLPQHGRDGFESQDYLDNLKKRKQLETICEINKLDKTKFFINWVKNDIISHPFLTARQYSLKFFQAQSFIISPLMKSNKSKIVKYGIHIYVNLVNYILLFASIYGLYMLYIRKEFRLFISFILFWGWSLCFVFVFHSEQRYMFPVRPVLILLFAFTLNILEENRKYSK